MKILILTFLFTLTSNFSFAQGQYVIDSLKYQLTITKQDTSRVQIMNYLCGKYRENNSDSALYYGQSALFLSRKIKYPYGESRASVGLGFTYEIIGNLPKALDLYLKGLKIAEKYVLMDAKAYALERIAAIYRKTNKYTQALSYSHQARQLFDSLHITNMWIIQLHNICRTYTEMNQLDSALYYANQTYENAKKYKLEELYFLNNFGRIYTKKGDTELALRYAKEALLIHL